VLSGHGTIDLAVQAVKEGAESFVTKPIKSGLLEALIGRLLQHQASRKRTIVQDAREARSELDPFLGSSPAIRALAEDARRMVAADGPLLLLGEPCSSARCCCATARRSASASSGSTPAPRRSAARSPGPAPTTSRSPSSSDATSSKSTRPKARTCSARRSGSASRAARCTRSSRASACCARRRDAG
jgi:hypothetical protein